MRYRWNNYCTVNLLADKYDEVEVYNYLIEETFRLPTDIVMWAQQLDGKTSPYDIDKSIDTDTVQYLLTILENYDCIRKSRFLVKSLSQTLFSLYIPQKITPRMRIFAWFYNKALQLLFLPVLIIGIYRIFMNPTSSVDLGFYIGNVAGMLLGLFLHEISHACATLACPNSRFFELGVGFSSLIPIGYALIDITQVKKRFQRIQAHLAGIETNLLLCGIFLIISSFFNSPFSLGIAFQNCILGFFNLVFKSGIDGCNAISEILGNRSLSFVSNSRKIVWCKKQRKKILNMGLNGYAIFTAACTFQILQLTYPAFLVFSIINIIEVFL